MFTLYLIRCRTPLHFYAGITSRPFDRWNEHRFRGGGSAFTKLHGVIQPYRVAEILVEEEARRAEWFLVVRLRTLHPNWIVAGAGASKSRPDRPHIPRPSWPRPAYRPSKAWQSTTPAKTDLSKTLQSHIAEFCEAFRDGSQDLERA